MTDYKKLVEALRHCGKDLMPGERCKDSCPYGDIALCLPKLKLDAASAIEALEAEVKRLQMHCADCEYGNSPWSEEPGHEPKRGEWIDRYDEDDKPFFKRKYVCSACGGWNTYGKSKFCPNCGAKMTEVQDGQ